MTMEPAYSATDTVLIDAPSPRAPRTWPAILTLFWLAPVVAEMFTGSTPPLAFIQPFNLIVQPAFYGCGALLAREIVRRRGWGWANLFVLGVAYSILEEAIGVQTWFNFTSISPTHTYHHYGEYFQTNWFWAMMVVIFLVGSSVHIVLPPIHIPRAGPRLWTVRLGAFGLTTGFYVLSTTLNATLIPAWGAMVVVAAYDALAIWRVRTWAARTGWNGRHRLALASGVLAFFALLFGPFVEFASGNPLEIGLVPFELLGLLALAWFARRVQRQTASPSVTIGPTT